MMKDQGIEQIIQQAIRFEEDAYQFYTKAVDMIKLSHVKETLKDLAEQEVGHKLKLEKLLRRDVEQVLGIPRRQVQDLKLAEYLVPQPLTAESTFQDVLIVAMNREKSSHEFYTTMSRISQDQAAKELFAFLAEEELRHKSRIETLYDEEVYKEF